MSSGIQRLGGVAALARDPAAAAAFAADTLGFNHAGAGEDGSQRLVGHGGPDPIDLVYVPGDAPGVHHITFVTDAPGAEKTVHHTPAGFRLHVVPGLGTPVPAAALAPVPDVAPAPICADSVGLAVVDVDAEVAFLQDELGMLVSAQVVDDAGTAAVHLRFPGRFLARQIVITRGAAAGVDHLQFAMKNLDAFYAARDAYVAAGVAVEGPLRHGPGHAVAMYVTDPEGYRLMFSVEDEVILDDTQYVPRTWSAGDPKVASEWPAA